MLTRTRSRCSNTARLAFISSARATSATKSTIGSLRSRMPRQSDIDRPPAERRCPLCNSPRVKQVREEQSISFIVLKLKCNACHNELIFWTGSRAEERARKRAAKTIRNNLS